MYRKVIDLPCLFVFVISLLWGQSVLAAGLYIPEVGTPVSVGTAGVGNPTNTGSADAAWTNPAGMTGLDDDVIDDRSDDLLVYWRGRIFDHVDPAARTVGQVVVVDVPGEVRMLFDEQ